MQKDIQITVEEGLHFDQEVKTSLSRNHEQECIKMNK